ncbi:DUF6325 family protein [Cellulomonas sp. HZM]|uniref:DUF6325 family protein n=1 Tax=Cellulomonas sp. HZM TaxID=1454010 RepID=UPI00049398A6|nr:DUF6325 family protein [Cellulomonas sp. HZM]
MSVGPVQYVLIAFPGSRFTGEIVPALVDLVEHATIRVIDIVFMKKDVTGAVEVFEYDALEETAAFAHLPGEAGGVLGDDDIARAAADLEPGSSAVLIVWEDTWATELAVAIRDAGGVILAGERIPRDAVEAALESVTSV